MTSRSLVLRGIPASPGIVIGRAKVLSDRGEVQASFRLIYTEEERTAELARFQGAVDQAQEDLSLLKEEIAGEFPEHAHLLELHLLILKDQMLYDEPRRLIRESNLNAEWALNQAFEKVKALFRRIEDPYIKGRIQDVESVYRRLLGNLTGKNPRRHFNAPDPIIIVARDLSPAETTQMTASQVVGFITERGGKTSHTAIVAQSLEIPAVVGVDAATQRIAPGVELILDGLTGRIIVEPGDDLRRTYRNRRQEFELFKGEVAAFSNLPAITPDEQRTRVMANIELPEEVAVAKKHGADGIGLYRTEFLYLRLRHVPSEEDLYQDYRRVVEEMAPLPVTIRTLDIGGDKFLSPLDYPQELNPALGLRAIRFCLKEQAIFRKQLRAILRASAHGPVQVMFPLISNVREMREARELLAELKEELVREGLPFDPRLPVGAMIEVPAAVTLAGLLSREADFFSIGTNDLIQYALAIDRGNKQVAEMYQPLHPAVLRMIKMVVEAGREAGIPVAMCGEMAGDPLYLPILLGLGVTELSMNAMAIPMVKHVIRSFEVQEARDMARHALELVTVEEINDYAAREMRQRFPEICRFSSALAGNLVT
ncbi:MAG: phosphoenolpyruvate--protein phosphotransferase [Deltaproteobacteria bacterium]|nr:phosphoenolpyruvate--protein phosphotransferase [Deltaproteobacteria bacterium]